MCDCALTFASFPEKKPNPTISRLSSGLPKLAGPLTGEWHTEEEICTQPSARAAVWAKRGAATGPCLRGCHPPSTISTAFPGCPCPAKVPKESSCHIKRATCDTLRSQIHYPPLSGSDAYTSGEKHRSPSSPTNSKSEHTKKHFCGAA